VAATALLAVMLALPCAAQVDKNKKKDGWGDPPRIPPPTTSGGPVIPVFVAILFGALILGVNLIPSKRGHQD
jgi:hypothetical protein